MGNEKGGNAVAKNLFEQTESLEGPLGERLSGDPEVLHEIQDWAHLSVSRDQIKAVLQYVPQVFPEGWESPDSFDGLTQDQKEAYTTIATIGPLLVLGPAIQKIIELGVAYRNQHTREDVKP